MELDAGADSPELFIMLPMIMLILVAGTLFGFWISDKIKMKKSKMVENRKVDNRIDLIDKILK
jgi:uncharacterized protein YneF (UPF0154 family)